MPRRDNVVDLTRYAGAGEEPILLLVDLQNEYVAAGRRLEIQGIAPALENCRRLLDHARAARWTIAHTRWLQPGPYFNRQLPYAGWIAGFEPYGTELVYERAGPSCYSAEDFDAFAECAGGQRIVIAGLTGVVACLATLIEGTARGHRLTFVADASASHGSSGCDEEQAHERATWVASHYVPVIETDDLVGGPSLSPARPHHGLLRHARHS